MSAPPAKQDAPPVHRPEERTTAGQTGPGAIGSAPEARANDVHKAPTECPTAPAETATNEAAPEPGCEEDVAEWRDRALRLQAEIDNFRKRQRRLTEERIRADRERLLRGFLSVSDDLERALEADSNDAASLREGVALTHQGLMQLMDREGVEPIDALGRPFDPTLHEGVATVPHQRAGVEPNTVVKVVETGYRYGDRLLRPARVIVAA
jgi:molecular chaperone GrpE